MDKKYFWAWTDFQSYVDCMLVFSVLGAAITYLLIEFSPFVELIGFLAVFTEAMLGAPQIAKNLQNKSTEGMRFVINNIPKKKLHVSINSKTINLK